jgi:hypothetical protein
VIASDEVAGVGVVGVGVVGVGVVGVGVVGVGVVGVGVVGVLRTGMLIEFEAAEFNEVPTPLIACTMKMYESPGESVVKLALVAEEPAVTVWSPSDGVVESMAVAANFVIPEPPSLVGAVQETVTEPSLFSVAEVPVGAPGTENVETGAVSGEAGPDPCELAAVTWNSYSSPALRPVTCADVATAPPLATGLTGAEVVSSTAPIVYPVSLPPGWLGAVQVTVTEPSEFAVVVRNLGAVGSAQAARAGLAAAGPEPLSPVAVTWKV